MFNFSHKNLIMRILRTNAIQKQFNCEVELDSELINRWHKRLFILTCHL